MGPLENWHISSLKFENLSYGYEGGVPIFSGVNFDFPVNRIVWINAPGGEGRSSLMQLLAGLLMPQSGKYFINDLDITEMTFEEFLPLRLRIGYGFDFGGLINNRTIFENLLLPIIYHRVLPREHGEKRVLDYLKFMGLLRYKDQRPALVPGGVRKLACMIRALILHPEMLLLDDPNVGMNEEVVLKYFDLVHLVQAQGAIKHLFLSSFDGRLANNLGAQEVLINEGQLYINEPDLKIVVNG